MPDLVIADEPTKGLDTDRVADVQAYLQEVTQEGRSLLLITHDIMLAQDIADELIVMYAGQVVECGPVQTVLTCPLHPYTRGLINSLPKHGFMPIEGYAPPLSNLPLGCRFAPRCRQASDRCHIHMPNIRRKNKQEVRCHQY
jgi:peptide/nickel transport system ATP-binding protein